MKITFMLMLTIILSLLWYGHVNSACLTTHIAKAIIYGWLSSLVLPLSLLIVLGVAVVIRELINRGDSNDV